MGMTAVAVGALALSAVATGMSAYGQVQAGKAAKANAEYQAGIARNNAIAAKYQADDIRKRGDEAADVHRQKVQQMLGRQRAVMSANGGDIGSGSNLDILGDTAASGELDALTIRNNAEREAWGVEVQGSNFSAQAGLLQAQGAQAQAAGNWGAGTSLLAGAGSFASSWYTLDSKGAFKADGKP